MQNNSRATKVRAYARSALSMMIVVALYGCAESSNDAGSDPLGGVPTVYLGAATTALEAVQYTSSTDTSFSATVRESGYTTLSWMESDAEIYEIYRRTLPAGVAAISAAGLLNDQGSACDDSTIFNDSTGNALAAAIVPMDYVFVGTSSSDAFVDDTLEGPGTYRYLVVGLDGVAGPSIVGSDLTIEVSTVIDTDVEATANQPDLGAAGESTAVVAESSAAPTSSEEALAAAGNPFDITDTETATDQSLETDTSAGLPTTDAPAVQTPVTQAPGAEVASAEAQAAEEQAAAERAAEQLAAVERAAAELAAAERVAEEQAAAERAAAELAAAERVADEQAAAERAAEELAVAEQAAEQAAEDLAAAERAAAQAAEDQVAAERAAEEQAAAEQAAAELAAAEQAAEQAAEELAAAERAAAQAVADQAAAERAAEELAAAEQAAAEQAAAEQAAAEQAAAEQAAAEQTAAEQAAAEQAAAEQAAAEQAATEQAAAELAAATPATDTSSNSAPEVAESAITSECEPSPSETVAVDSGLEEDADGGVGEPPVDGDPKVVPTTLPDSGAANSPDSELLAFPGAVGHGRHASGGRGGRVVIVDTLENKVNAGDGRTSLREALEVMSGPRIVTFAVGGVFDTGSAFVNMKGAKGSDVTIACQTAPSPGVVIKGLGLRLVNGAHNVIMRHCTMRNIDPGRPNSEGSRAITISGEKNAVEDMIFDHLSLSWSTDENWTVFIGPGAQVNNSRFTLSNSIIAEGDADSTHAESGRLPDRYLHAMGPSCNSASTTFRIKGCSIMSNLIAHNGRRNPLMWGVSGEIINNRIYNWHETALDARSWKNGLLEVHVIDNEFKAGPTSKSGKDPFKLLGTAPASHFRASGNRMVTYPDRRTVKIGDASTGSPREAASRAAPFDVNCVGASRPGRDEIDARIVSEYKNSSGQVGIFNNHKRDYSMYRSSKWDASHDADRDGMADSWELGAGLDPTNGNDYKGDLDGDGYTNLEEYINGMAECG